MCNLCKRKWFRTFQTSAEMTIIDSRSVYKIRLSIKFVAPEFEKLKGCNVWNTMYACNRYHEKTVLIRRRGDHWPMNQYGEQKYVFTYMFCWMSSFTCCAQSWRGRDNLICWTPAQNLCLTHSSPYSCNEMNRELQQHLLPHLNMQCWIILKR